jgi:hypothetical protein
MDNVEGKTLDNCAAMQFVGILFHTKDLKWEMSVIKGSDMKCSDAK